jgi:hypothetical protein
VLKNKHQAASQGRYKLEARGLRLEAQNKFRPSPTGFQLQASSFQPIPCEHLQKPHNVGSRPQAQFFNILLKEATTIPVDGGVASL